MHLWGAPAGEQQGRRSTGLSLVASPMRLVGSATRWR